MAIPLEDPNEKSLWQKFTQTGFVFIVAWIVAIWFIEIVDTALLGERLQRQGIQPRTGGGLDGILWSPFLHSTFSHLMSNTAPLAILGGLVAIRGRAHWLLVTAASIIFGGGLTWAFARTGNHIGSSGVVFGYLGALIGAAVFERRMAYIAPAVIAVFFYGTIFVGLVPQNDISWEGHLAGLIAGAGTTFWLSKTRPTVVPPKLDPADDLSLLLSEAELFGETDRDGF